MCRKWTVLSYTFFIVSEFILIKYFSDSSNQSGNNLYSFILICIPSFDIGLTLSIMFFCSFWFNVLLQEEQLIQRMTPETQGKILGKIIKSEFLAQKITSHEIFLVKPF